jgi:hypothetical protein
VACFLKLGAIEDEKQQACYKQVMYVLAWKNNKIKMPSTVGLTALLFLNF